MAQPKNTKRLSEVEYCLSSYFNAHFVPVMNREKSALQAAQAKEIADYSTSFAGIMRSLAQSSSSAGIPGPDDTMQYLRLTGKECSKTAEDYVGMCKESILGNKDFLCIVLILLMQCYCTSCATKGKIGIFLKKRIFWILSYEKHTKPPHFFCKNCIKKSYSCIFFRKFYSIFQISML